MAFDECTEYPADAARMRQSMELTLRWAARSKQYFEDHKHTSHGTRKLRTRELKLEIPSQLVRPNLSLESCKAAWISALRKESAERTVEIGFPGYAIGGLSVGEPRQLTREVVEAPSSICPRINPAISWE